MLYEHRLDLTVPTPKTHAPFDVLFLFPHVKGVVMLRDPLARVCSAFKFLHSVGMEPAVRERMKQEVKTPKEWIRFDGIASCQTKMLVQRRCAENCKSLCRIWRVLELHACHCFAEACLDEALVRGGAQATPSSLNSAFLP